MAAPDRQPGRRRAEPQPRLRLRRRAVAAHPPAANRASARPRRAGTSPATPATSATPAPQDPAAQHPEAAAPDATSGAPAAGDAAKPAVAASRAEPAPPTGAPKPGRAAEPAATAAPAATAEPAAAAAPAGTLKPAPAPTEPAAHLKRAAASEPNEDAEPVEDAPTGVPPEPRSRRRFRPSTRVLTALWFLVTGAGLAAVLLDWTQLAVPASAPRAGSVAVTTGYAYALGVRAGGRPWVSAALAMALSAAAVATGAPVLLAGAAVSTAALGAVLGVLSTTPAVRFRQVVRECVVAAAVTGAAAFAASGYDAQVSFQRVGYLVLSLAMGAALVLGYRLGNGLQGLGRRGAVMLIGGVTLMAVSLAYTEALARWGPPGLVGNIEQVTADLRAAVGAVPRPMEVLLGFPALAWTVSTRARRRQGWWAAAFGAGGLAVIAVSLLNPGVALVEAGLSAGYSLVLGLCLGYLVIRADRFFSGARGRRARRAEEASAHRPEPGRVQPLL